MLSNGKGGKKGGVTFVDSTGIFEFSGSGEAQQTWQHCFAGVVAERCSNADDKPLAKNRIRVRW